MSWKRKAKTKKGWTRCLLYRVWCGIRERCMSPSHRVYHRYGGRGITLCGDWLDYSNFRRWAVANGYRKGVCIDRIDNNLGYEPGNCQWLTRSEHQKKTMTVDSPRKGEQLPQSKLTEAGVRDIRNRRASGETCTAIAQGYGVSVSNVVQIVKRKAWKHVD